VTGANRRARVSSRTTRTDFRQGCLIPLYVTTRFGRPPWRVGRSAHSERTRRTESPTSSEIFAHGTRRVASSRTR
jgi:hypothetical protein